MPEAWPLTAAVYALGVVIGLVLVDGSPAVKLALALAWPLGPLAFAATLIVLGGASLIAFPWFGAAVLLAAAAYAAS